MTYSIFYSWQSDSPHKINRNFIEDALKKAIKTVGQDFEVQEALRDDKVQLDKDTKGVPGIPPIVEAILKKISECNIFVPDITFVGKSEAGRFLPNPNVLIEYGWALREVTHNRMIPIMNEAFGEITDNSLPFDMRHLRRPITYFLAEDASAEKRAEVKTKLVKALTQAIKLIIKNIPVKDKSHVGPVFSQIQPTFNPSVFLGPDEELGQLRFFDDTPVSITVPEVESIFLRLIPTKPIEDITNKLAAKKMMEAGRVQPLGQTGGQYARNKYGAFVCNYVNDRVTCFTQLFLNGELWGIDTIAIEKEKHMKFMDVEFGYFPCVSFERVFLDAMSNYLGFMKNHLEVSLPIKFIAGATNVLGYRMTAPPNMSFGGFDRFAGNVVDEHITFEGMIDDWNKGPAEILRPFFEHVWEECGLERPDF